MTIEHHREEIDGKQYTVVDQAVVSEISLADWMTLSPHVAFDTNKTLRDCQLSIVEGSRLLFRRATVQNVSLGSKAERANMTVLRFKRCGVADLKMNGAKVRTADFTSSRFIRCSFGAAKLSNLKAEGARFQSCNFKGAVLDGAMMNGADFTPSRLQSDRTTFQFANLSSAQMSDVYGAGTQFDDACMHGVRAHGAMFPDASFQNTNLRGADLDGADLRRANLRGADLTGAHLIGANLAGADLTGAILKNANLTGANLFGAKLDRASFKDAVMERAILDQSTGANVSFQAADLDKTQWIKAEFDRPDFRGAQMVTREPRIAPNHFAPGVDPTLGARISRGRYADFKFSGQARAIQLDRQVGMAGFIAVAAAGAVGFAGLAVGVGSEISGEVMGELLGDGAKAAIGGGAGLVLATGMKHFVTALHTLSEDRQKGLVHTAITSVASRIQKRLASITSAAGQGLEIGHLTVASASDIATRRALQGAISYIRSNDLLKDGNKPAEAPNPFTAAIAAVLAEEEIILCRREELNLAMIEIAARMKVMAADGEGRIGDRDRAAGRQDQKSILLLNVEAFRDLPAHFNPKHRPTAQALRILGNGEIESIWFTQSGRGAKPEIAFVERVRATSMKAPQIRGFVSSVRSLSKAIEAQLAAGAEAPAADSVDDEDEDALQPA